MSALLMPYLLGIAMLFAKPARGTALLERRDKRAAIRAHEIAEKSKVVRRDGLHTCRLVPGCTEKEKHETAHVQSKGAGGDHSLRTSTANMLRACIFHHRGSISLHSGMLRVEFLSELGADGPIATWQQDERGGWFMVGREIAVGAWEKD